MLISVIGLPGSGKTTVLHGLRERFAVATRDEDPQRFRLLPRSDTGSQALALLNHADFLLQKIGDAVEFENAHPFALVEVDWVTCHLQWTKALCIAGRLAPPGARVCSALFGAAKRGGVPVPARLYCLQAPLSAIRARLARRDGPSVFPGDMLEALAGFDPRRSARACGAEAVILDAAWPAGRLVDAIARDIADLLQRGRVAAS